MADVIRARGLVKRFGSVVALDGLDLDVPEGSVLGLLGPNGAGKTTAVSILTTLLEPDGGTAIVAGHDVAKHPNEVRKLIGLSGQYAAVDEHLTGLATTREVLGRFAAGDHPCEEHGFTVVVPVQGGAQVLVQALRELDAAGVTVKDVGLRRPTLDEVFIRLTGHAAEQIDPEQEPVGGVVSSGP